MRVNPRLLWLATFTMLLAACSVAQLQNAQQVLVAAQPIESSIACQLQAAANASTDVLAAQGDATGAATSSGLSTGFGTFCNGLAAGQPLPVPVTVPATNPALIAAQQTASSITSAAPVAGSAPEPAPSSAPASAGDVIPGSPGCIAGASYQASDDTLPTYNPACVAYLTSLSTAPASGP
jgi:hypothetical protein